MSSSDSETATIVVVIIVSFILIAVAVWNLRWIRNVWNGMMQEQKDNVHDQEENKVYQNLVVYYVNTPDSWATTDQLKQLLVESKVNYNDMPVRIKDPPALYERITTNTSDPNTQYILCCTGITAWMVIRTVQTIFEQEKRANIFVIAVDPLVTDEEQYNSYTSLAKKHIIRYSNYFKSSDVLVPESPDDLKKNIHVYSFRNNLSIQITEIYQNAATLHYMKPFNDQTLQDSFDFLC